MEINVFHMCKKPNTPNEEDGPRGVGLIDHLVLSIS